MDKLLNILIDERRKIADGLAESPSQSYEKYMFQVGKYAGLKEAEKILLDLLRGDEED